MAGMKGIAAIVDIADMARIVDMADIADMAVMTRPQLPVSQLARRLANPLAQANLLAFTADKLGSKV
jgi:hypothetical protein